MLLLVLASFLPSLRTDSFQTAAYAPRSGVPPSRPPWRRSAAAQAELRCDPRATRQLLTPVHRRRGAYQPVQHGHAASASPAARHGRTQARRYLLRLLHLLLREELQAARRLGWPRSPSPTSEVVYGGRDDGCPARRKEPSATGPPGAPRCHESRNDSGSFGRPSLRLAAPSAAPGTTAGSGQEAGADTARSSSDSALGTRRRLTERSPRGPTGPEPPPVRV